MAAAEMNGIIRHIRRMAVAHDGGAFTDGQLLQQFLAHRDETAFEALVRRYGSMVLGVCRRVLHNRQDAEDAFQATFLILVHKAGSITQPELLGNWLYGVAYRTARNAKVSAARRLDRERQVSKMAQTVPAAEDDSLRDAMQLLDEEVNRLPEKYRVPVVLCELHGKSRKEVASYLGCSQGTVSSRLARARQLLRKRLVGRGVALSAASMAVALSRDAVSAAVPPSLVLSTVKSATLLITGKAATAGAASAYVASLTDGVLKYMFLAKLRAATAVLLVVSALSAGVAWVGFQGLTATADEGKSRDALPARREVPMPLQAPFTAEEAKAAQRAWAKHLGKKEEEEIDLGSEVKMVFVLIPPGTFEMGSPREELKLKGNDKAFADETPQHKVTITKPFYLGKYPVTQAEYVQVTGKKNPSVYNGVGGQDTSRFPVESVNWADADECRAALEKKLGSGWGKARLPSEAMWEYACRAGTQTRWHVGNRLTDADARFGHAKGNLKIPGAVGSGTANAFGLYDMHGNVWQWCSDRYGKYSAADQTDPEGPDKGSARAFRGGSYYHSAERCRSAARGSVTLLKPQNPSARNFYVGFRLAVNPNDPGK